MGSDEMPPIDVLCKVNDEESATVYEDEPLILSVSLVNDAAATAESYNTPHINQILELEKKFKEKQRDEEFKRAVEEIEQRMLKVTIYRIGGPEGWPKFIKFQALLEGIWREVNWPLKLLMYLPKSQVANLDATTSCYVEYSLDPEDVQRPKGEFQVKAVVEIATDITVESDVVTINFLQQKMPKAERIKEENLFAKARYAYRRGLYDEALEFIQSALKINPSSIPSLNLLGDIEHKMGNLPEALSAYEKAFEEFNKQLPKVREPPLLTIKKIKMLRASIEE